MYDSAICGDFCTAKCNKFDLTNQNKLEWLHKSILPRLFQSNKVISHVSWIELRYWNIFPESMTGFEENYIQNFCQYFMKINKHGLVWLKKEKILKHMSCLWLFLHKNKQTIKKNCQKNHVTFALTNTRKHKACAIASKLIKCLSLNSLNWVFDEK